MNGQSWVAKGLVGRRRVRACVVMWLHHTLWLASDQVVDRVQTLR